MDGQGYFWVTPGNNSKKSPRNNKISYPKKGNFWNIFHNSTSPGFPNLQILPYPERVERRQKARKSLYS